MTYTNVWRSVRVFGSTIPKADPNVHLKTQLQPVFNTVTIMVIYPVKRSSDNLGLRNTPGQNKQSQKKLLKLRHESF